MPEIDDDLLQRYYDGELSPVEDRRVRSQVEGDPAAQDRLKRLAQLSEALQAAAAEAGREVDSEALFTSIADGIARDSDRGGPGTLEVIAGEWSARREGPWIPLAMAGAVAAAALLFVLGRGTDDPATVAERQAQLAEQATAEHDAPAEQEQEQEKTARAPETPHGSRVEDVDFGDSTGTVFAIETRGITTAVVWIADGEEVSP